MLEISSKFQVCANCHGQMVTLSTQGSRHLNRGRSCHPTLSLPSHARRFHFSKTAAQRLLDNIGQGQGRSALPQTVCYRKVSNCWPPKSHCIIQQILAGSKAHLVASGIYSPIGNGHSFGSWFTGLDWLAGRVPGPGLLFRYQPLPLLDGLPLFNKLPTPASNEMPQANYSTQETMLGWLGR